MIPAPPNGMNNDTQAAPMVMPKNTDAGNFLPVDAPPVPRYPHAHASTLPRLFDHL
ncbi:hypothetical protein N9D61_01700 [Planktomarina sp.]|nr:hypothetical protein [Planktomarina sp.]